MATHAHCCPQTSSTSESFGWWRYQSKLVIRHTGNSCLPSCLHRRTDEQTDELEYGQMSLTKGSGEQLIHIAWHMPLLTVHLFCIPSSCDIYYYFQLTHPLPIPLKLLEDRVNVEGIDEDDEENEADVGAVGEVLSVEEAFDTDALRYCTTPAGVGESCTHMHTHKHSKQHEYVGRLAETTISIIQLLSEYVAIYTYKRAVCVCLSAFYRPHGICPLCGAASEYCESSQAVAGGPARRAGKCMHSARARARACRTTSQRKNRCADAFQKQLAVRARTCCRIRNCWDFQKKGKKKTNMPLPKFSPLCGAASNEIESGA